MNEYEIMIKNLENRVTELEKQLFAGAVKTVEPVKWQPEGGDWYVSGSGKVFWYTTRTQGYREFGTERDTEEQAQRASVQMRRFNRLLALRDELCGDEVVDFNGHGYKYFVYFNHSIEEWEIDFDGYFQRNLPYFTTKQLAQKACDMLNSGEVEL